MADAPAWLASAVLVSCDAFDNYPPGLTGKTLVASGRLPIAFGWLTKRGDAATARWMEPVLTQAGIRRDTVRVLRAISADRRLLVMTAERLADFKHPALIVWAGEDRVMPPGVIQAFTLGAGRAR